MDLCRLARDELEYELELRGFSGSTETILSMRKKLKELMRDESFGELVVSETFKPEIVEEIDKCNRKITDLETYLTDHDTIVANSNESRYVDAKLRHLLARLTRLNPPNDALKNSVSNLNNRLQEIEENLDKKLNGIDDNEPRNVPPPIAAVPNTSRAPSVPVYKWDVRFSGAREGLSVNAFIERVEEFRISRGISQSELFNSITDLLTGKALSWYRSVRGNINSWPEFVDKLRGNYLPFNFQNDLMKEIREREQGPDETVSEFFSCMINYFSRLQKKLTEQEKIEIIYNNLDSFYIERMGLHIKNLNTVDKLQETCQNLENSKNMITRRVASRRENRNRANILEPDLTYEGNLTSTQISQPSTSRNRRSNFSVNSISCWNCGDLGHKFTECRKPREKSFCFRCGKAGVTKYNCGCSSKNESSGRRFPGRRS